MPRNLLVPPPDYRLVQSGTFNLAACCPTRLNEVLQKSYPCPIASCRLIVRRGHARGIVQGSFSYVVVSFCRLRFTEHVRLDTQRLPSKRLLALTVSGEVGQDHMLHVPIPEVVSIQQSQSAARRVLSTDDLLWGIGKALLARYTCVPTVYPHGTKKQLLSLALTCRAWQDVGLGLLWRNFENVDVLVDMLVPSHLRSSYTDPQAKYQYVSKRSPYRGHGRRR